MNSTQENKSLGQVAFEKRHEDFNPKPLWTDLSKVQKAEEDEAAQAVVRFFLETRGVLDFIRRATLELQTHGSRTPAQMKSLFDAAYRLYVELDVESRLTQPVVQESEEEWEVFEPYTTKYQEGDEFWTALRWALVTQKHLFGTQNDFKIRRRKRPSQAQDKPTVGEVPRTVADQKEQGSIGDDVEYSGVTHHLKCWQPYFDEVARGRKRFEVRYNEDRDFKIGDRLILQEYDPGDRSFSGRELTVDVLYVLKGNDGMFGIPANVSVMSIKLRTEQTASAQQIALTPKERERPSGLPIAAQEERKDGFEEWLANEAPRFVSVQHAARVAYHSRDEEVAALKEEVKEAKKALDASEVSYKDVNKRYELALQQNASLFAELELWKAGELWHTAHTDKLDSLTSELERVKTENKELREGWAKQVSGNEQQIQSSKDELERVKAENEEWKKLNRQQIDEIQSLQKQLEEEKALHESVRNACADLEFESIGLKKTISELRKLSTWVSCSERMPTKEDADCKGNVEWLRHHDHKGEWMPWDHPNGKGYCIAWRPTNLPAPREEVKEEFIIEHVCPPIPDRNFDWKVIRKQDEGEENAVTGWGSTKERAIRDLKMELEAGE